MAYTTADLLAAIGRRSFAPTGQITYTDEDLLAVADEVLASEILPVILSVREEHFVTSVDYAITADQAAYDIPPRAIAMAVRDIWLVDGSSIDPSFPRVEPENAVGGSGAPAGWYLQNNSIILDPSPATTAKTIRVFFTLAPGRHVLAASAGLISAINTSTNVVTVSAIPSTWATGDVYDLIRKDGGQEPRSVDLTSTLVTGNTITLPSLPTGLAVGDYVALAGETPLPFLPKELRPALAQGTAAQILADMNQPGAEKADAKFRRLLEGAVRMLAPRTIGEDRVVTPAPWF